MAKHDRSQTNKKSFLKQFSYLVVVFLGGYFAATALDIVSLRHWIDKTFLTKRDAQNRQSRSRALGQVELPAPKLEFYTLLAKERNAQPLVKQFSPAPIQEIAPREVKKNNLPLASKTKEPYVVQIAAFKNKQDAERMKAELLLKGFEASILQKKNDDWFRVTVGPFNSRSDAQKTQVNLARNEHIKGMLRKLET